MCIIHMECQGSNCLFKKIQNLKILSAPIKVLSHCLRVRLFCYANLQGYYLIPLMYENIVQFLKRQTFKIVSGIQTKADAQTSTDLPCCYSISLSFVGFIPFNDLIVNLLETLHCTLA